MSLQSRIARVLLSALVLLALVSLVSTFSPPAHAAVGLIVTKTADTNDGTCDADCSLREAITAANANTPLAETITFNIPGTDPGCTAANVCTITLGLSLPGITDDVTIDGSVNSADITVSGNNAVRPLAVLSGKALSLNRLTIANGYCSGGCATGGGVANIGTLNVTNSTFSGNSAAVAAGFGGGGIFNGSGGTVNIANSTFSGNSVTGASTRGGGIFNNTGGTVNIANSTFYGNSATGEGGGIVNFGTVNLKNSILSGNSAGTGADCYNNSGATISGSNNLVDDTSCAGSGSGSLGRIGAVTNFDTTLADNGGPTATHKLNGGSNALEAVPSGQCTYLSSGTNPLFTNGATIPTDQRGVIRPQNTLCDVGAYELLYCSPGTFDNGSATCEPAAPGYFVPVNGATSATPCPPGYFQTASGATSCVDADPGYYVPTMASTSQTPCPPGSNSAVAAVACFQTGPSFVVNDATDTDDSACDALPGDCTLREAINAANGLSGADTITFDILDTGADCASDNVCTITLGSYNFLSILDDVTIDGAANGAQITVSGANTYRVMTVNGGTTLNVNTLTIADAYCTCAGAGIYSTGTVNVTNSTLRGNSGTPGGGIFNDGGTLNIANSTFSGNTGTGGGGVYNLSGTLNIANSTFSNNVGGNGGGVFNFGTPANITNSTFSGNSANNGGAIYNLDTLNLKNSILTNTLNGGDCVNSGTITGSNNLIGDTSCGSGSPFRLGAVTNFDTTLADNGGPTKTHKLNADSNALEAVPSGQCNYVSSGTNPLFNDGATIPADQRGVIRPQNTLCDVGAYESPSLTDDFVITVKTDNAGTSTSTQFTIPTTGGGYNYNVDCNNDGTSEATAQTGDYTCAYGAAGTYTIRIKDNTGLKTGFPRIYFNDGGDKLKLLTIEQWGTGKWTSMDNAFFGCANLAGQASDNPDLSGVTVLSRMFRGATAFNQDMSGWNTSTVTSMAAMFRDAPAFNRNIGSWNTANVTDMTGMFFGATTFNQDISNWNTGNVTGMSFMLNSASAFNQPIGNWDVSQVTNMQAMLTNTSAFNQPLATWNTGSVTNMQGLFGGSAFNQPIGNWDTSKVTTMFGMFSTNGNFNQNIGSWDTSKVTNMGFMFNGATAFDQNLGGWNVTALTNAASMFASNALSTANYDALLIGWDAQALQAGVTFDGGNSKYCAGTAARANMISSDTWSITDGGSDCVPQTGPTFIVNDAADTDDGSCDLAPGNCTLREAINAANALSGADTIEFDIPDDAGALCSSNNVCTITLSTLGTLPGISDNVTIDGAPNSGDITVSGAGTYRVMYVSTTTLNLNALTIANGKCTTSCTFGGGILNEGTLNVSDSTFSGNTANYGAGIYNLSATVNVTHSTFTNNSTTTGSGGGIVNLGGFLTVTDSTFSNNQTINDGGGINNENAVSLTVTNSTFSGNTANRGGAININNTSGAVKVTNSTFSGNGARFGGGIANASGTGLTLTNSTLSGNSASDAGGTGGGGIRNTATLVLKNTIIANSSNGGDCVNPATVTGNNNLIEDSTNACGLTDGTNGNIIGTDPNLGALASNGGPTQTMALSNLSVAIDAGDDAVCDDNSQPYSVNSLDQRGEARNDLNCDIGAFEFVLSDGNTISKAWLTGTDPSSFTFGPTLADMLLNSGSPLTLVVRREDIPTATPPGTPPANALPFLWDATTKERPFSLIVTLCYDPTGLTPTYEDSLHVWHYNGSSWDDLGGELNIFDYLPYHCVTAANPLSSLSPLLLAPGGPTATNVTGVKGLVNKNGNIVLRWKTTSETQIAGFNIWRQGKQGEWKQINNSFRQAKHAGAALGDKYRFIDRQANADKTYRYKIEIVYLDGHTEWTNVIKINTR